MLKFSRDSQNLVLKFSLTVRITFEVVPGIKDLFLSCA